MKAWLRAQLRRAVCWLLYYSGLVALLRQLDRRYARGRYRILFFHHVVGDGDPLSNYLRAAGFMTRPSFAELMAYLARHYTVVSLDDIAAGHPLPPGAIALTFDDGYADNFSQALPILQRYRLPATFFVATAAIDSGCPLWYDAISLALLETAASDIRVSAGDRTLAFSLNTLPDRVRAAKSIAYALKSLPDDDKEQAMAQLIASLGLSSERLTPLGWMLTWPQVQAMSRMDSITIGAHTVTHPVLSRVSLARAEAEITTCRARIAQQIGRPVHLFSYPDGTAASYSPAVVDLVRTSGFTLAVTTIPGSNGPASDLLTLRRIAVDGDPIYVSATRLLFTRDIIKGMVRRLRGG